MPLECCPYGTRLLWRAFPGTHVPAFHMPPFRGWNSRTLPTKAVLFVHVYSTVTDAWAPVTLIACSPGSRAPPRVMVSGVCPLAFAWKVSVTTHHWPEMPLAPLGRDAVICD